MTASLEKYVEAPLSAGYESFSLDKAARDFAAKSNSAETRRTYSNYLQEFFAFAGITEGFQAIRVQFEIIVRWRDSMTKNGSKPNTVKTKLAAVRSFYEHLKHLGVIELNPASTFLVVPPKTADEPSGRALTNSQVRLLLELPKKNTIIGARDFALILLMLRTFMRVSEAVSLREDDFFYKQNSWFVKVKIKGGAEKNVPIPKDVKKAIDDYHFLDRDHRAMVKVKERESKFVFMPTMGKITRHHATDNLHLSTRHVWHILKKYSTDLFKPDILKIKLENPKLDEKIIKKAFKLTPHDLRRTAITRALDQGESYRRVMNASRHKSITSIQRYDLHRQNQEENSIFTLNYDE